LHSNFSKSKTSSYYGTICGDGTNLSELGTVSYVQNGVKFGFEYPVKTDKIHSKDYKDEFKCVTKSMLLVDKFNFCTLCRSDVNIAFMVGVTAVGKMRPVRLLLVCLAHG